MRDKTAYEKMAAAVMLISPASVVVRMMENNGDEIL
jgi:hypothetical protein